MRETTGRRMRVTRKAFVDLAIAMVGFGLAMGIVFPFFVLLLGVSAGEALTARFFAACIAAGLIVGAVNFWLARSLVGGRLRLLTKRMRSTESAIREAMETGVSTELQRGKLSLEIDSDDEIGETAAAYNFMIAAFDASRAVEAMLIDLVSLMNRTTGVEEFSDAALTHLCSRADATSGTLYVYDEAYRKVATFGAVHTPDNPRELPAAAQAIESGELSVRPAQPGERWTGSIPLRRRRGPTGIAILDFDRAADAGVVSLLRGSASGLGVMLGNVIDAERLQRVLEAQAREARAQGILASAADPMMTWDEGCRILTINTAALALFSADEAQLVGSDVRKRLVAELVEDAGRDVHLTPGEAKVLMVGQESDAWRQNGEPLPIEISLSAFDSANGRVFTAILRDLTQRQLLQRQLVAQEKLASLGGLAAGIAHEIKNPLNFITNFASINADLVEELRELIAGCAESTEVSPQKLAEVTAVVESVGQTAARIVEHCGRADRVIVNTLSLSRSSPGARIRADVNPLVKESVNLAWHGIRGVDPSIACDLEVQLTDQPLEIEMVRADLGRVLLNVIGNAFQAVQERRQEGDERYEPQVRVQTALEHDEVVITVADNGPGIPEAVRQKIFEPFFTTKAPGEGTGLGLSISHEIVTAEHNGTMSVESREGEGSEFCIRLPVGAAPGAG